jgi:hypothetical protein
MSMNIAAIPEHTAAVTEIEMTDAARCTRRVAGIAMVTTPTAAISI